MRRGNFRGGRLAVGVAPAIIEPVGRVDSGRLGFGENRVALSREAAEHAVHQPPRAAGAAIARGMSDREVDGRVVRDVEKENLCGGDVQDGGERAGARRQRAVEARGKGRFDLAAMAECSAKDGAHQGTVAREERLEMRVRTAIVEQRIERRTPLDDVPQQRRRRAADGESGRIPWRGRALVLEAASARRFQPQGPRLRMPARDHGPGDPASDCRGASKDAGRRDTVPPVIC